MNIDKDIEILKEFKEKGFASLMIKYNKDRIQTNTMVEMAIENVLSELETYKRIANMNLKDSEEFNKNMCEHRCPIKSDYEEVKQELETYKKIAKHLAYAIEHNLQDDIITDILCDFTRDNKLCSEKCINCILDWARKEVSNEK